MTSINSDFVSDLELERYLERFDPPPSYQEVMSKSFSSQKQVTVHHRTHPSSEIIDMLYTSQTTDSQTNRSVNRNRRPKRICFCC